MKTILPYLLLAVALILLFFLFQSNRELAKLRMEDNRRAQETIARHRDTIKTVTARINELQAKGIKDRDSAKVAQSALKIEIRRYESKIASLRPKVQAKIDSFPDLRDFVANQDSVISRQDSLLRDTELFCQLQVRDLSKIIELQEQKFEAQKQITAAVTEQLAKETREHRKTKRRSALKSVGLGILSAGIVIISLKE